MREKSQPHRGQLPYESHEGGGLEQASLNPATRASRRHSLHGLLHGLCVRIASGGGRDSERGGTGRGGAGGRANGNGW